MYENEDWIKKDLWNYTRSDTKIDKIRLFFEIPLTDKVERVILETTETSIHFVRRV